MNVNDKKIKHYVECVPGVIRNEVYELDDMKYIESFDDCSGERLYGIVTMYDGVKVCAVNVDGTIMLTMPTNWVTNHRDMMNLVVDIDRLDAFITDVCKKYK